MGFFQDWLERNNFESFFFMYDGWTPGLYWSWKNYLCLHKCSPCSLNDLFSTFNNNFAKNNLRRVFFQKCVTMNCAVFISKIIVFYFTFIIPYFATRIDITFCYILKWLSVLTHAHRIKWNTTTIVCPSNSKWISKNNRTTTIVGVNICISVCPYST